MIKAYVFVKGSSEGEFESLPNVLSIVRAIKGIKQAHAVLGPIDGIAYAEVEDFEELGKTLEAIRKITGVASIDTRIAWPF